MKKSKVSFTCSIVHPFYLLIFSASVSASTAHSGQVLELGLSGSFTHDLTVLTEQGRCVYSHISVAALACVSPFSTSRTRNAALLSDTISIVLYKGHADLSFCRDFHYFTDSPIDRNF